MSVSDLQRRIRDLELENMELKSKLDQYQSIFPASGGGSGNVAAVSGNNPESGRIRRTNRGVGISAEPANMRNLTELRNQTFPEFKKSEK